MKGRLARAVAALALPLVGACAPQPRGGWEQYPNLTPKVYVSNRLDFDIEGRARLTGPAVTEIELEAYPTSLPIVSVKLSDERGRTRVIADALVDTGHQGSLGLSNRAARRAGAWLWPEARGQERFWALDQGVASPAVVAGMSIGDAALSGIPASVHGGNTFPVTLGLDLLRCWSRAVLDFQRQRLVLHAAPATGTPVAGGLALPFEWWDDAALSGKGEAWVKNHGFIAVQATMNGSPVKVLIDTGAGFDLVVPASFAQESPWREALDAHETVTVHSSHTDAKARTARVHGAFRLGDQTLEGLTAVIIDDSTLPPGPRLPPLVGAGILRRYKSVEFDFESQAIRLSK